MEGTHLGFPRRAALCRALNPLLFVSIMSALWSSSNVNMSSLFLEMASCKGVSPSESCQHHAHKSILYNMQSNWLMDGYLEQTFPPPHTVCANCTHSASASDNNSIMDFDMLESKVFSVYYGLPS